MKTRKMRCMKRWKKQVLAAGFTAIGNDPLRWMRLTRHYFQSNKVISRFYSLIR